MKKLLFILIACGACSLMQSCLEYDEPGDELGFGEISSIQPVDSTTVKK